MAEPVRPGLASIDWPQISASRFVSVQGLRWHVQMTGAGPLALLIHGTGASSHSWEGLAKTLEREFSLILVDLPGHGLTDPLPAAEMTLAGLARRLGCLIQALDVKPELVIGHSAGAAIAVRMALDRQMSPPRSIVAVNGALLPFGGLARYVFPPMARVLATGSLAAWLLARRAEQDGAVSRMLRGTGSNPPARSTAIYTELLRRPTQVQAALDMMANWDLESLERDLPRLAVPLVLVACGEDRAVDPATAFKVRDICRAASVRFVRGLGHLAHEEDPAVIAASIREAWQAVAADPQGRGGCVAPLAATPNKGAVS